MRESIFKLILQYMDHIIKGTSDIDLFAHAVADIEKQKEKLLPVYNDFKKKIEDQKYLGSLTVPEQHALGQNELNHKKLLREMDEAITQLIRQKWTNNVRMALWYLDDVRLLIEDVLDEYDLLSPGQITKPRALFNEKKFAAADYIGRITMVQTAINILRDEVMADADFGDDTGKIFKFMIFTSLGKVTRILQQELETTEANGMPDLHQFEVPEVIVPEIPDAAPPPKKDKQLKLELEEVK